MNILIVGDVFGMLGRKALSLGLKKIKETEKINFLVVNAENITHGRGMNAEHYKFLVSEGVNAITMGNHTFGNQGILGLLEDNKNIVIPYNYKNEFKGCYKVFNYNGLKICVFQMLGVIYMKDEVENPFVCAKEILKNVKADLYISDYHGEATSEKIAYGFCFDGLIDIMVGTHTHVPTGDFRMLPKGSSYITDIGMTGALNSVLGVKKEIIIKRMAEESQAHFVPETVGPMQFNAVLVEYDENKHKVVNGRHIHYEFD